MELMDTCSIVIQMIDTVTYVFKWRNRYIRLYKYKAGQ